MSICVYVCVMRSVWQADQSLLFVCLFSHFVSLLGNPFMAFSQCCVSWLGSASNFNSNCNWHAQTLSTNSLYRTYTHTHTYKEPDSLTLAHSRAYNLLRDPIFFLFWPKTILTNVAKIVAVQQYMFAAPLHLSCSCCCMLLLLLLLLYLLLLLLLLPLASGRQTLLQFEQTTKLRWLPRHYSICFTVSRSEASAKSNNNNTNNNNMKYCRGDLTTWHVVPIASIVVVSVAGVGSQFLAKSSVYPGEKQNYLVPDS